MTITNNPTYKGLDRAFCVRMKSTLTKRGCHFKSSGYRVNNYSYFFLNPLLYEFLIAGGSNALST